MKKELLYLPLLFFIFFVLNAQQSQPVVFKAVSNTGTSITFANIISPATKFHSIDEAVKETALPGLYGGIHFRYANEKGVKEGEQTGKWVVTRSAASNNKAAAFSVREINTSL